MVTLRRAIEANPLLMNHLPARPGTGSHGVVIAVVQGEGIVGEIVLGLGEDHEPERAVGVRQRTNYSP